MTVDAHKSCLASLARCRGHAVHLNENAYHYQELPDWKRTLGALRTGGIPGGRRSASTPQGETLLRRAVISSNAQKTSKCSMLRETRKK